jgi:integrase/recombinase XerD
MLTIWRRHRYKCKHKADRYFRKCRCAIWCEGTIEGTYTRRSLKTRSWERATELAREIEDGTDQEPEITVEEAVALFIADCEARNLQPPTIRKSKPSRERFWHQFPREGCPWVAI